MKLVGVAEGEDVMSMCSLMSGGRLFGIDTRMIREVLGHAQMNRVPLSPAYVGGVIAYRGEVVTALDEWRLSIFGTNMYLLYMPNRHHTRAAASFIEFILEQARGSGRGVAA